MFTDYKTLHCFHLKGSRLFDSGGLRDILPRLAASSAGANPAWNESAVLSSGHEVHSKELFTVRVSLDLGVGLWGSSGRARRVEGESSRLESKKGGFLGFLGATIAASIWKRGGMGLLETENQRSRAICCDLVFKGFYCF